MAAPKGNSFWMARSSHGRKPIFESPDALWAACVEYFEWVEKHPLIEAKPFSYEGSVTMAKVPKMRAMTIVGLCIFLDIERSTWSEYGKRDDFSVIASRVEDIIRTQKFEGASAGLLQPNIIARDLGLAEKNEHTGKDGGPIEHEVSARDALARRISGIAERSGKG